MANSRSWQAIFDYCEIHKHNFDSAPFALAARDIKRACQNFENTNEKEVRILCKQDTREDRPDIFKEKGLFLLPVKNGHYNIIKGEGYVDIEEISGEVKTYDSKLDFKPETSQIGNSEMQHLDYAYASSLIRNFTSDDSLVLTIRGRKYTPKFSFNVGKHLIEAEKVQTEVDGGYEGKSQVVLIEAKNSLDNNVIIRQLYYPYRQWQKHTDKKVNILFFNRTQATDIYHLRQFQFNKIDDYNSIELLRAEKFRIKN